MRPLREDKVQSKGKSQYDYMRRADEKEEDAFFPEEWEEDLCPTDREEYFGFYDDVKTNIKEDW